MQPIAMLMSPIRAVVQAGVSRVFLRDWDDERVVINRFIQALNTDLHDTTVASVLVQHLPPALHVPEVACLLLDTPPPSEHGTLTVQASSESDAVPIAALPAAGALARFLTDHPNPIETTGLREALAGARLATEEAALLGHASIFVWVPLVLKSRLEGLLLLGKKQTGALFSRADKYVLAVIAKHAAIAANNMYLVEAMRQQSHELVISKDKFQQAHRHALAAREEERKKLANEIHDSPLQDLVGINFKLRQCARQPCDEHMAALLEELRVESTNVIAQLRRICSGLHPPALDSLGLAPAMYTYMELYPDALETIEFQLADGWERLPRDVATTLYRIFQEAVANALKYANAQRIIIRLAFPVNVCLLTIQDNGQGFLVPEPLELLALNGHLGLIGMKERVDAIGGTLDVVSMPGDGTTISVRMALQ
jgi:signal transduction histidine kinase